MDSVWTVSGRNRINSSEHLWSRKFEVQNLINAAFFVFEIQTQIGIAPCYLSQIQEQGISLYDVLKSSKWTDMKECIAKAERKVDDRSMWKIQYLFDIFYSWKLKVTLDTKFKRIPIILDSFCIPQMAKCFTGVRMPAHIPNSKWNQCLGIFKVHPQEFISECIAKLLGIWKFAVLFKVEKQVYFIWIPTSASWILIKLGLRGNDQ